MGNERSIPTRRALRAGLLACVLSLGAGATARSAHSGLQSPLETPPLVFDHSPWDHVLKRYVTETGRVDYAALRAASTELDRYVAALAARSPISDPATFPTRASQLAYWINAYNALVMKSVIEHWPVRSVRNIGRLPFSFFWHQKFQLGGKAYTLDNVEDILRKDLTEPRIHFAIVCASNSCPRLQREAYTEENVERLLGEAARFYLNESRNLRIDAAQNRVTLARILGHYRQDFERYVRAQNPASSGQPLLDYIKLYAEPTTRAALDVLRNPRIEFFGYDWGINDVHAPGATRKFASQED